VSWGHKFQLGRHKYLFEANFENFERQGASQMEILIKIPTPKKEVEKYVTNLRSVLMDALIALSQKTKTRIDLKQKAKNRSAASTYYLILKNLKYAKEVTDILCQAEKTYLPLGKNEIKITIEISDLEGDFEENASHIQCILETATFNYMMKDVCNLTKEIAFALYDAPKIFSKGKRNENNN